MLRVLSPSGVATGVGVGTGVPAAQPVIVITATTRPEVISNLRGIGFLLR